MKHIYCNKHEFLMSLGTIRPIQSRLEGHRRRKGEGEAEKEVVGQGVRIGERPGDPGSRGVLSANGSLPFGRYSEACNGRVERFLCQVQIYFRSYYSGFYHYVLA